MTWLCLSVVLVLNTNQLPEYVASVKAQRRTGASDESSGSKVTKADMIHRAIELSRKVVAEQQVERHSAQVRTFQRQVSSLKPALEPNSPLLCLALTMDGDTYSRSETKPIPPEIVKRAGVAALRLRKTTIADDDDRKMIELAALHYVRWLANTEGGRQAHAAAMQLLATPPRFSDPTDRGWWLYSVAYATSRLNRDFLVSEAGRQLISQVEELEQKWFPPRDYPDGNPLTIHVAYCRALVAHYSRNIAEAEAGYQSIVQRHKAALERGQNRFFHLFELMMARRHQVDIFRANRAHSKMTKAAEDVATCAQEMFELRPDNSYTFRIYVTRQREYAVVLYHRNNVDQAINVLEQAVQTCATLHPETKGYDKVYMLLMRQELADFHRVRGRRRVGLEMLQKLSQEFSQLDDSYPGKKRWCLDVELSLAAALMSLDRFLEASQKLVEIEREFESWEADAVEKGKREIKLRDLQIRLAYHEVRPEAVLSLVEQASDIPLSISDPYTIIRHHVRHLLHRVTALVRLGKHRNAQETFDQLDSFVAKAVPSVPRAIQVILLLDRNIAAVRLHQSTKRWDKALPAALALCSSDADTAESSGLSYDKRHRSLSDSYYAVGNYAEALAAIDKAESVCREELAHGRERLYRMLALIPATRGKILMAMGRHAEAGACFLRVAEQEPQLFFDVGISRSADTAIRQIVFWNRGADLLISAETAAHLDVEAVYRSLIPYRGLVFRILAESARMKRRAKTVTDWNKCNEYVKKREQIARLAFQLHQADAELELSERLSQVKQECESLRRDLSGSGFLADGRQFREENDLDRIRRSIRPGEVVLDFVEYRRYTWDRSLPGDRGHKIEPRYRVYVVPANGEIRYRELGSCREVDRAIVAWRREIASGRGVECGQALAKLVWKPIVELLPQEARRILICPAGRMSLVAWSALPNLGDGSPLIARYEFAYLPYVGRLCSRSDSAPRKRSKSILVVGDVDYGDGRQLVQAENELSGFRNAALKITPLPATRQESATIARLWEGGDVVRLSGKTATADRVVEELQKMDWVHLATHGILGRRERVAAFARAGRNTQWLEVLRYTPNIINPLSLSALALSGAARDETGEALLIAEQIAALDLSQVELVVLSACDTGRGPILSTDGVFSLHRAFLMAGAQGVISSLWEVPDQGTAKLMEEFYRRTQVQGLPPHRALREAQLAIARSKRAVEEGRARGPNLARRRSIPAKDFRYRPPREWAGFFFAGVIK